MLEPTGQPRCRSLRWGFFLGSWAAAQFEDIVPNIQLPEAMRTLAEKNIAQTRMATAHAKFRQIAREAD